MFQNFSSYVTGPEPDVYKLVAYYSLNKRMHKSMVQIQLKSFFKFNNVLRPCKWSKRYHEKHSVVRLLLNIFKISKTLITISKGLLEELRKSQHLRAFMQ